MVVQILYIPEYMLLLVLNVGKFVDTFNYLNDIIFVGMVT